LLSKLLPEAIDAAVIARLIPHHGDMCLLEDVRHYDESSIVCTATSHRLESNPLRENDMLHSACGVEYAAQAMAVHAALYATPGTAEPRGGRLAGVRSLVLEVTRLDEMQSDLEIGATRIMGDSTGMVYEFVISANSRKLLAGTATILLTA
jgi:predicted hotdog family 3-hydroxylacyl-ACP dehydratase